MKTEYILNGSKITSEKALTNGLKWEIGKNLDILNDVLSRGFGCSD